MPNVRTVNNFEKYLWDNILSAETLRQWAGKLHFCLFVCKAIFGKYPYLGRCFSIEPSSVGWRVKRNLTFWILRNLLPQLLLDVQFTVEFNAIMVDCWWNSNYKPIQFEIIAIHISWECNDDAVNFQEIHLLWRYFVDSINVIGTYNAGRNFTLFSFENNKALYSTAQWVQLSEFNAQML